MRFNDMHGPGSKSTWLPRICVTAVLYTAVIWILGGQDEIFLFHFAFACGRAKKSNPKLGLITQMNQFSALKKYNKMGNYVLSKMLQNIN
jgi:hypothetical protein